MPRNIVRDSLGNRASASGLVAFSSAAAFRIEPRRVLGGDRINIYGRNFPAGDANAITVSFGGLSGAVIRVSSRVITAEVPIGAQSGAVTISVAGGPPILAGNLRAEGLTLSPATIGLDYGESEQFNAAVTGGMNGPIEWAVNGIPGGNSDVGTISASGLYIAPGPTSNSDFPFNISATSAELGITAYAIVTTRCADSSPVLDEVFATGVLNVPYRRSCHTFTAQAGESAYLAFIGAVPARSLKVRDSNNNVIAAAGPGLTIKIPQVSIQAGGTYTVEIEADSTQSGSYQLWMNQFSTPPVRGTWLFPGSGEWSDASNWSLGLLPAATDVVAIPDYPGDNTVTVSMGSQSCASVVCEERLTLAGGNLLVAGTLLVNNALSLSGGALTNATVLRGTGAQQIQIGTSTNNTFDGVTVNGDLLLSSNSARLRIRNGLSVSGAVRLSGPNASLGFEGSQTIASGNTIIFEGPSGNKGIGMTGAGHTLTIASGAEVRGSRGSIGSTPGTWGSPAMTLVNQGTISADASGQAIGLVTSDLTNSGVIEATSGAVINLQNTWNNSGTLIANGGTLNLGGSFATSALGTIQNNAGTVNFTGMIDNSGSTLALSGTTGSWNLVGGTITGGTLDLTSALLSIGTSTNNTFDGVTVNGDLLLSSNSARLRIRNGLSVSGAVRLSGPNASLGFEGSQTIASGNTIIFEGPSGNKGIGMTGAGHTLTIASGAEVRGSRGSIGSTPGTWGSPAMTLVNQGTISADAMGETLAVSASSFTSSGVFQADNGGQVSVSAAWVTNGTVLIGPTSSISSSGSITQNGGVIELLGGSLSSSGAISVIAGEVRGTGNINASVANNGSLYPGGVGTPGTLSINGDFSQSASGILAMDLGGLVAGTEHDQLLVTGAATLDGSLSLNAVGTFQPALGNAFSVLSYASVSGSFTLSSVGFGSGLGAQATYGAAGLDVNVVSMP